MRVSQLFSDQDRPQKILWLLFLMHCALSIFFMQMDPTINNDGILYLRTAEAFSTQGLSEALGLYRWPFYSLLIAGVQSITHLSYLHAANFINFGLQAALFFVFIKLVSQLSLDKRAPIVAGLVLITFAYFNEYRAMIIRDFGYWVALLLSVVYWCKTGERLGWRPIFAALGCSIVAILFRVEGVVFLALGPVVLLLNSQSWKLRYQYFLMAVISGAVLLFISLLSIWYLRSGTSDISIAHLLQAPMSIKQTFINNKALFSQSVLNYFSQKYAGVMLAGGLATLYFLKIINLLTPIHAWLFVANVYQRIRNGLSDSAKIILWFVALNVLITAVFLTQAFFISSRYMMAMALLMLAFTPAQILRLYDRWRQGPNTHIWQQILLPFVVVYLVYSFTVSVGSAFKSKRYINDAAIWLREHVPPSAKLYSNERHILYIANKHSDYLPAYFDHKHEFDAVLQGKWKSYDYIALRVRAQHLGSLKVFQNEYKQPPIRVFAGKNSNRVLIFKID